MAVGAANLSAGMRQVVARLIERYRSTLRPIPGDADHPRPQAG